MFSHLVCSHPRLSRAVSSHVVLGVTSQRYCCLWSIWCGVCVKIRRSWSLPVLIHPSLSYLGDQTGRVTSTASVRNFSLSSSSLQHLSRCSIGLYKQTLIITFSRCIYIKIRRVKSQKPVQVVFLPRLVLLMCGNKQHLDSFLWV